jgi:hypothetical protein
MGIRSDEREGENVTGGRRKCTKKSFIICTIHETFL